MLLYDFHDALSRKFEKKFNLVEFGLPGAYSPIRRICFEWNPSNLNFEVKMK